MVAPPKSAEEGYHLSEDLADDAYAEPRAPYFHAREAVLERARQEGAAVLCAGPSRSVPVQRLVESGWLLEMSALRPARRV